MANPLAGNAYTVEAAIAAPGLQVEVRNWHYPTDRKLIVQHCEPDPLLTMLLSPWPNHTKGAYSVAAKEARYQEVGPLMLLLPRRPLYFRAPRGSFRAVQARMNESLFDGLEPVRLPWDELSLSDCLDIRSVRLSEGLARLAEEAVAPGFASAAYAEALATQIAVEILRYFGAPLRATAPRGRGLPPWQLHKINDFLRDSTGQAPTIKELSELCHMSGRNLLRLFKGTTGKTLIQHMAEVRASRARELLSGTELSLKEVAFELGFSGPSSFSVAFRRATGMTPLSFRLQSRGR